jgi:hypothetical protein
MFDQPHVCQCTILIINIFNYILLKNIKIVYFENTHRDLGRLFWDGWSILLIRALGYTMWLES